MEMSNPWLDIPEADYIGHMNSPAVGQRPVLGRLLGEALETVRPKVVLVLGCSTGNGLEHVNPAVTSRILESLFRFVEPTALVDAARGNGLNLNARRAEALPAGKSFEVLRFIKDAV
jgi:hypothetical protein